MLPYNGTMMYDNGGYLPPGLTTVVNLTGKPEPVFTADQCGKLGAATATAVPSTTSLTSRARTSRPRTSSGDLDFTFRRIKRARAGTQEPDS